MNYKTTCYSGSDLPKSYKTFARRLIKKIDSELAYGGRGKVEKASVGFYYFSLFFTLNGKLYYACSHDARMGKLQMYYRTAKHLTDYTGGRNMDFDINKVKELK